MPKLNSRLAADIREAHMKDPLDRFLEAQESTYEVALREIRNGQKESHWMWYIFPQLRGLGSSSTSILYGIRDLAEARDYLRHPVLGPRLVTITKAALESNTSALVMLGEVDALKLSSCMTLFSAAAGEDSIFSEALSRIVRVDEKTVKKIEKNGGLK